MEHCHLSVWIHLKSFGSITHCPAYIFKCNLLVELMELWPRLTALRSG